jgi:hypothetical protein
MINNSQKHNSNLLEGLEKSDLKRMIHPELHVDEFKSKLGDDADVIVLSFKVGAKGPSDDLVAFVEKGYEWVLDADVSSGEMEDGAYIVFVELDRGPDAIDNIMQLMEQLMNLTDQKLEDWRIRYFKSREERPFSQEAVEELVPCSSEAYNREYGQEPLDKMRAAAGVKVTTKAPKNEYTETLRNLAGIIR